MRYQNNSLRPIYTFNFRVQYLLRFELEKSYSKQSFSLFQMMGICIFLKSEQNLKILKIHKCEWLILVRLLLLKSHWTAKLDTEIWCANIPLLGNISSAILSAWKFSKFKTVTDWFQQEYTCSNCSKLQNQTLKSDV